MKNIANIITSIRIVCAVIIPFVQPLSPLFFVLYICCGVSDMIDGFIARATRSVSKQGALLDSAADIIFVAAVFISLFPVLIIPTWLWIGIGMIALIRIASYTIGFIKYRTFAALHIYSNKLAGGLLFCFPVLYIALGMNIAGALLGSVAVLSALEELVITLRSKELNRDCKSIFIPSTRD